MEVWALSKVLGLKWFLRPVKFLSQEKKKVKKIKDFHFPKDTRHELEL